MNRAGSKPQPRLRNVPPAGAALPLVLRQDHPGSNASISNLFSVFPMPKAYHSDSVPPMKSEVMLHDLVKLPQILRRLAAQQLEWAPLAKVLLTVSPDERVPTSKRLQQELGLAASQYRRWLDALYAAYLNLLAADSEAICHREAEYQLILTGRRATQVVHCRLPATPRVGEQLELDFLYAVTGDYLFYVESLTHDLSGGEYVIRVHLQHGYYNDYRQQLLQRARFEETLSIQVELSAPGYLLDDFLRERYPPPAESPRAYELLEKAEARYGRRSRSR